jgi:hypothetical protein
MRLYSLLAELEQRLGGKRTLRDCHGRLSWPDRGVYFFFEDGQTRSTSGDGARVVRVGTHAVSRGSKTRLWQRLAAHRGSKLTGGGNHRGSVFRLLVGSALIAEDQLTTCPQWGRGGSATASIREMEFSVEHAVSEYLGRMQVLWLEIDNEPSPKSLRSYIERNSIALLSALDPQPATGWALAVRAKKCDARDYGIRITLTWHATRTSWQRLKGWSPKASHHSVSPLLPLSPFSCVLRRPEPQ